MIADMTHPQLTSLLSEARVAELRAAAGGPEHRHRDLSIANAVRAQESITLRFGFPDDAAALAQLAALDSAPVPDPPLLLAEAAGELRAALSLATDKVIADPFHLTESLVDLLRARAQQLKGADPGRRRLPIWTARLRSLIAWR